MKCKKLAAYTYTQNTLGANHSPTLLDNATKFPNAAQAAHENFYKENFLRPISTRDEAIKVKRSELDLG